MMLIFKGIRFFGVQIFRLNLDTTLKLQKVTRKLFEIQRKLQIRETPETFGKLVK